MSETIYVVVLEKTDGHKILIGRTDKWGMAMISLKQLMDQPGKDYKEARLTECAQVLTIEERTDKKQWMTTNEVLLQRVVFKDGNIELVE